MERLIIPMGLSRSFWLAFTLINASLPQTAVVSRML
jgi:hypothetical protein